MNKFIEFFKWNNLKNLPKNIFKRENFTPKKIGKYLLISIGVFLVIITLLFAWYSKELPTPGKLKKIQPVESTKIMDRNGNVLYDIHGEIRRTVIDFNDMPGSIKNATLAAEDKDFYKHFGFSIKGILRSVYYNLTGKTGYISGGSTITQQFVKNSLLSSEKTYDRKIKELILTIEVEFMYSKDEILGMYLNEIPYGSNAYGIEEAAKTYFGKSAKDITVYESATLASLPKAPSYYSPYGNHPDKLEERKDYILDRMASLNYISEEESKTAKEEKLNFIPFKENITAPHFVMYVKEKLTELYGEKMVQEGGLRVTTTLDLDKQNIAEDTIDWGYDKNKSYGTPNASLVSIDPKTGQILCMVGSHDFFDKENDGQVNVADTEQQPGSSFKPIVYAAAFKEHYNPAYVLWDVTTDFGNYTPQNYDGRTHGPVTIRQALSNSLNIPAVKMLALIGLDKALDTAHDMGITTLNDPDRYGLALVLGGGEVKLIDHTTAFGVFADKGTLHDTTAFLKIENTKGKVLLEYQENKGKKEVLDPQIAYEISNILSDNGARSMVFGANHPYLTFGDRPVAVKTGTTQEFRDAWTMGYTPSVVTGVWVGHNDNTPMKGGADGSVVAAPIWHKYMEEVLKDTPIEQFERPDGIEEVTVDKLSNKKPSANSPELIKDIFASWQVPTEFDDIHVKVKVCKVCDDDKLATDLCPPDQTDERTYTNLHSEEPDNPNWEQPVLSWAKSHGIFASSPPKENCDLDNKFPSINITSPQSDATVSGNFSINADASATFGVKEVEFYIDNVYIGSDNNNPYSITYNANNLSSENHEVKVTVVDEKGLTASNTITIKVIKDTNPPGNVSNVTLTSLVKAINIAWKNPSDGDLEKVKIYASTVPGNIGTVKAEIAASPNTNSNYTISGLLSNINYYFTIHAIDTSGNENTSTSQYSGKPN